MAWTNFVNGTTADADEVNDNFDYVKIKRKQFSDATARTHTGDTNWADSGTAFVFSAPANSLILGGIFSCRLGHDGGGGSTGYLNIKITGATMATSYITKGRFYVPENGAVPSGMPLYDTGEDSLWVKVDEGLSMFTTYIPPMKIEDATTTFTIRIKTSNDADTTTIDNATMDLIYVTAYDED